MCGAFPPRGSHVGECFYFFSRHHIFPCRLQAAIPSRSP
jgi:hypothetical protein